MRAMVLRALVRRTGIRWPLALVGALILAALGTTFVRHARAPETIGVASVERGRLLREVTALGVLKAVNATPIIVPVNPQQSRKIASLVPNGSFVRKGQIIAVFDAADATRELTDGESDRATAENKIASTRATGEKTRGEFDSDRRRAREDRERAQDVAPTEEQIFSRHEIIESAVDRELLDKRVALAGRKIDASTSLNRAEVKLAEVERGKADIRVRAAKAALGALEVTAPHDGLFVLERGWRGEVISVGQQVWPGQKIAEIPDLAALEARVFVLEADAGGLEIGRRATIVIEGKADKVYAAKVARVEPIAKPRGWQSPVKYFEATLTLTKQDPALMKPGQRVSAHIVLDDLDGVLTVPRGSLFEKDGKRVVYRREGRGFRAVEVVVGRSSLARVVVEKGLAAGDLVALRDPTRALQDILKSRSAEPSSGAGQGAR
jgi:HlyD family secretion protein